MKNRKYLIYFLIFLILAAVAGGMFYRWGPNQIHTKQLSLTGYKGMRVKSETKTEITDSAVKEEAYRELANDGIFEKIRNQKIKQGDIVHVKVRGYIDGIEKKDMSMEDYDLEIGSHTFIDGFESGLMDRKPGKWITLNLTFPENYSNASYAGQDVEFQVYVYYIKKNYSEDTLTDQIVKKNASYKNRKALYQSVRKKMEQQQEKAVSEQQRKDLWKAILKKADVKDYPDSYWEEEIEAFDKSYEEKAEALNITKEEFLDQYCGYDEKEYAKLREETCEENAKKRVIVNAIAKKEGIEAKSYDELAKKVESLLMEHAKFIS